MLVQVGICVCSIADLKLADLVKNSKFMFTLPIMQHRGEQNSCKKGQSTLQMACLLQIGFHWNYFYVRSATYLCLNVLC